MKKLYIVRHAKSDRNNTELIDFDRPLNDRGRTDAPKMGKRLKKRGVIPDLMISSPAVRALSTCTFMASIMDYPIENIQFEKRLYHADSDQILTIIRSLASEELSSLMIFGHNPGLSEFADRLLPGAIDSIPTCGVVAVKLDIKSWKEISWGCGELMFFDVPRIGE